MRHVRLLLGLLSLLPAWAAADPFYNEGESQASLALRALTPLEQRYLRSPTLAEALVLLESSDRAARDYFVKNDGEPAPPLSLDPGRCALAGVYLRHVPALTANLLEESAAKPRRLPAPLAKAFSEGFNQAAWCDATKDALRTAWSRTLVTLAKRAVLELPGTREGETAALTQAGEALVSIAVINHGPRGAAPQKAGLAACARGRGDAYAAIGLPLWTEGAEKLRKRVEAMRAERAQVACFAGRAVVVLAKEAVEPLTSVSYQPSIDDDLYQRQWRFKVVITPPLLGTMERRPPGFIVEVKPTGCGKKAVVPPGSRVALRTTRRLEHQQRFTVSALATGPRSLPDADGVPGPYEVYVEKDLAQIDRALAAAEKEAATLETVVKEATRVGSPAALQLRADILAACQGWR